MKLNAKKKRAAAKQQRKADAATKWCSTPGAEFGYHGSYTGKRCPKCQKEGARRP